MRPLVALDPLVTFATGDVRVIDAFGRQFGLAVSRLGRGRRHRSQPAHRGPRRQASHRRDPDGRGLAVDEALAALRTAAAAS